MTIRQRATPPHDTATIDSVAKHTHTQNISLQISIQCKPFFYKLKSLLSVASDLCKLTVRLVVSKRNCCSVAHKIKKHNTVDK